MLHHNTFNTNHICGALSRQYFVTRCNVFNTMVTCCKLENFILEFMIAGGSSLFPEEPKIDWRSKQAKYFGHLSDGGQSVVGVRKWSKQRLRGAGTPSGQEEHLHPLYTPLPPLIPYLWSSDILEHTKHNNTSVCLPNYPTTEPHIYPSQSQQYICNQV